MNKQIALFRGINVGGHNILKMNELKSLLESLGLNNVKSYIQSGNIVFDSQATGLEETIKIKVNDAFNIDVNLLLLTSTQLQNLVDESPYKHKESKSQHFFFLKSPPSTIDLSKLESIQADDESFLLTDKVLYLYAPSGIGRSKIASKVEKILDVTITARNRNTVNRILQMCVT